MHSTRDASDRSPAPTTISPVTAPPWNASRNARPKPLLAASATRRFARTDTFMPMNPAPALATEPARNPNAYHLPSDGSTNTTSRIGTPTFAIVRYWRDRNASAPLRIAAAISFARSVLVGAAITRRKSPTPTTRAAIAAIKDRTFWNMDQGSPGVGRRRRPGLMDFARLRLAARNLRAPASGPAGS